MRSNFVVKRMTRFSNSSDRTQSFCKVDNVRQHLARFPRAARGGGASGKDLNSSGRVCSKT